jgi:hypothetical protein
MRRKTSENIEKEAGQGDGTCRLPLFITNSASSMPSPGAKKSIICLNAVKVEP